MQQLESRILLAAVSSVTTSGSEITAGTGNLNEGDAVTLTVNFDAAVFVNRTNGAPTLSLNDGGIATYASGSATTALTFVYTVSPGENTGDLTITALNLNGSTIKDSSNVDATLTGAAANPAGTLVIDTTAPIIQSINRRTPSDATTNASSVSWTVTLSEAVKGVDLWDFEVVRTGSVAITGMQVSALSGSVYTVTFSGVTGDGTLGLNLIDNESIRDFAGNEITALNSVISFETQLTLPTGTTPIAVAIADVDRDGWPDLVVANLGDNTIGVLMGHGDGTFQPQQTFATGIKPIAIMVGDFNGDGKPDVVVTNESGVNVSVLLGNGDGTFQPHQTFATGAAPFSVAVGDVNGDGRLDLAVANFNGDSSISLLLGTGDGTFQPQRLLPVGLNPSSVSLADLNADEQLDVVATNLSDNTLSVLLGNGDGTFQAQQTFAVGTSPWSVAVGDVNGDNKADLLVANNNGHSLGLLLGNGDGTFQSQQTFATGISPTSALIADLNGDGRQDLLADNWNSHTISVFRGNGNGTFQAQQTFGTGMSPRVMVAGDLNGDGKPDLVTGNEFGHNLSVLLNNSRGNFTGQVYNIGIRLLTPIPNAYTLRPTFRWTPAAGATSYELHINNESTGVARFHMATVTGTTYTPSVDLAIGKFRLWIRPIIGTTRGNWTPPFSFANQTMPSWEPIDRVQLTSRPTLAWKTLPGAAKYDLWIDNYSTGQKQVVRQDVGGTSWSPASDLPMGTYRAWIRGLDAKGNPTLWSVMSEFHVLPGTTPLSPVNATFNRSPEFSWTAVTGAASYEVYVRNKNTGAMIHNGISVPSTSWTPPAALPDGLYQWYALAVSPNNFRSGGSTTVDIFIGGRPTVLGPAGSSSDTTPTFTWRPVDGAASYRLIVNRLDVPQSGVVNQSGLTTTEFTPATPLASGTYRAWVRAVSTSGELSPWSLEVSFSIAQWSAFHDDLDAEFQPDHFLVSDISRNAAETRVLLRAVAARNEDDPHESITIAASEASDVRRERADTPKKDNASYRDSPGNYFALDLLMSRFASHDMIGHVNYPR